MPRRYESYPGRFLAAMTRASRDSITVEFKTKGEAVKATQMFYGMRQAHAAFLDRRKKDLARTPEGATRSIEIIRGDIARMQGEYQDMLFVSIKHGRTPQGGFTITLFNSQNLGMLEIDEAIKRSLETGPIVTEEDETLAMIYLPSPEAEAAMAAEAESPLRKDASLGYKEYKDMMRKVQEDAAAAEKNNSPASHRGD